ncbi:tRNA (guanosine(46)-N7)-methyltransferase TrmB [Microvirga guangxiensis]|uniref:tRNA (guanine-N(7)-)-methyltransferase n=1 Tax=Microvirga guangxiensis TaxID=549386 RepID=A0A1G5G327_9HYPH|nr:tRNA (guanosine(46)-N7)-methyltransferase TrmB [Microvirga guangxiensis]SCY45902.1 tRNA (guanine-N7-)-methyltransferase [Microvirga guangxiensis]
MSEASKQTGAFFGRRKGKKLRSRHDDLIHHLLPAIRAIPGSAPAGQFPNVNPRETWLEIGFGGGEHLAHQARTHRDINFIGCEPFVNGMAKLLAAVDHEKLDNIRVWDDDVTKLLPTLPDACFDRVYILYPDPWPKRRQRKRRLVSDEMLVELARVLKPGGELRFASDIDDYIGWVLSRILRSDHFRWTAKRADDWRTPYEGWPGTRYEAKAIREGRVPSYLTMVRI